MGATIPGGEEDAFSEATTIRSYVLDLPELAPTVTTVTPGKAALEVTWTTAEDDTDGPVRAYVVNALENGRYDPSLPLAFKIAALFNERIEALFMPD